MTPCYLCLWVVHPPRRGFHWNMPITLIKFILLPTPTLRFTEGLMSLLFNPVGAVLKILEDDPCVFELIPDLI